MVNFEVKSFKKLFIFSFLYSLIKRYCTKSSYYLNKVISSKKNNSNVKKIYYKVNLHVNTKLCTNFIF